MQRLIKNSSSPPVHKAQARAAFCLLCHFPNRPRLELPLHRLCSSTALFPLLFLVAKGRLVQSSGYHDLRGQFGEKGGNFSEILMLPAFTWFLTHKAISPHMNTSIMYLFFLSKRRRERKWKNFLFRIDKFFLKLFPTCFILFNLTYWTTLVFFWSLFSRRLWSKTSWAKKTIHAIAKSPPTK